MPLPATSRRRRPAAGAQTPGSATSAAGEVGDCHDSTPARETATPPVASSAERRKPLTTIEDILADAMAKQDMLSQTITDRAADADVSELARLLAIHGQNASRLGRLLRDKRALSGDAADGLLDALGKALDEISTQLGIKL